MASVYCRTPLGAQLWRWSAVPLPPRRTGSTRLFATAESDTADDLRLVYEVGGKPVLLADLNLEEKKELYVRLCENDIDYNQMKVRS